MLKQLEKIASRYNVLTKLLQSKEVLQNTNQLKKYFKEQANIFPAFEIYQKYVQIENSLKECESILKESNDQDLKHLALTEKEDLSQNLIKLQQSARIFLTPKDPRDQKNVILEIRAGIGGDEAGLFVADLLKMYNKFAEFKKWQWDLLEVHIAPSGGYKFVVINIKGTSVYSFLKFESGTHRVQRIPLTESQGRIHTSAATVAVLAEPDPIDITIKTSDLKIDTFRSQGAGGQHVNTTDSAVRITHLPTNIVVSCQEERSQIKNRERAMKYLGTKIYEKNLKETADEQSTIRKAMVGSGNRSEKIRTYNYPQNRITDHRVKISKSSLDEIMSSGNILDFTVALLAQEKIKLIEDSE